MLPGIDIKFDNGNIGTVVATADGVFGLVASAVAVVDTFALNTPYTVKGMADVAALGILPDVDNYRLYKALKEFYAEAGEGTKLWLMGFAKTDSVSDWFAADVTSGKAPVEVLLDASNGEITALFTAFSPDETYILVTTDGIDDDIAVAKANAQLLAENYMALNFAPLFVIIEAYGFTGVALDLPDLLLEANNRVAVFIGDTETRTGTTASLGAAVAVLAGRLAKIQVHENAGKVKLGALETLTAFILDAPVESYDVAALHDKGFVTFRTHVRKAGYYISDDPLATAMIDDYHYISRRRVIDKAFRLAHNIASNEILADFDLQNDGTIDPLFAKTVEGNIEREIAQQMTSNGELSASATDKDDLGVVATFNMTKNVATTNRIELSLKVRPKGYARWFDILLGYDVNLNN
jgi:hypothetical protein